MSSSLHRINEFNSDSVFSHDKLYSQYSKDYATIQFNSNVKLNRATSIKLSEKLIQRNQYANSGCGSDEKLNKKVPSSKQMKEFIERNSVSTILGVENKKQMLKHAQSSQMNDQELSSPILNKNNSAQEKELTFQKGFISKKQYGQSDKLPKSQLGVLFSQTSEILKKMMQKNKKRESIGKIPSEMLVEAQSKWIPKAALAKLNLPENFVLENTNQQMNIAELRPKIAQSMSLMLQQSAQTVNSLPNSLSQNCIQERVTRSERNLQFRSKSKEKSRNISEKQRTQQEDQQSQMDKSKIGEKSYSEIESKQIILNLNRDSLTPEKVKQEAQDYYIFQDLSIIDPNSPNKLTENTKVFKENEVERKGKAMVRENQKSLNKKGRKFGLFVEFSKVGPARSVTSMQTRADHLFNRRNKLFQNDSNDAINQQSITNNNMTNNQSKSQDQGYKKVDLLIPYQGGIDIQKDMTQWKLVQDNNTSRSHLLSRNKQKDQKGQAINLLKDVQSQLEKETIEQIASKTYKTRTNLDSIVQNMRGINLARVNSSYKSLHQNSTIEQLRSNQSSHLLKQSYENRTNNQRDSLSPESKAIHQSFSTHGLHKESNNVAQGSYSSRAKLNFTDGIQIISPATSPKYTPSLGQNQSPLRFQGMQASKLLSRFSQQDKQFSEQLAQASKKQYQSEQNLQQTKEGSQVGSFTSIQSPSPTFWNNQSEALGNFNFRKRIT